MLDTVWEKEKGAEYKNEHQRNLQETIPVNGNANEIVIQLGRSNCCYFRATAPINAVHHDEKRFI